MKGIYETPQMYAESFVANQYIAACQEPISRTPEYAV